MSSATTDGVLPLAGKHVLAVVAEVDEHLLEDARHDDVRRVALRAHLPPPC